MTRYTFGSNGPAALLLVLSAVAAAQADEAAPADARPTDEQIRFFEARIRPLLASRCYDCHGEDVQESGLRLDSLRGILTGGKAGAAVVPHKPDRSLLVTAVSYRDSELRMPPDKKLSGRQIADLTRWVAMGVPHPDGGNVDATRLRPTIDIEAGRKHWAFRPPAKPPVPRVSHHHAAQVENAIDAFLLAELDQHGLRPRGRADKRTLIRRATFDLIGLPPTPDEIAAFLADESPEAFCRVIDRLLASPHYGERWGRHWLDVARYADSNGLDENAAHGSAWRYRDYVVDAFNGDMPYREFLVEQLAGDLLDSGSDVQIRNRRLIATGYLSLGPKVLAEVDARKMEMDIVDEQLDTIGRGLMGLTLGCCRCHDHKFDPLGQHDYYALAGIFKSTRTMETFKIVARWHENQIGLPDDIRRKAEHERLVAAKQKQIDDVLAEARRRLEETASEETASEETGAGDFDESRFSDDTKAALQHLREELKQRQASAPEMPMAMGVVDGTVADVAIHLRGSHLTLDDVVSRGFPRVLSGDRQSRLPDDQSGRLEFARWLTADRHPLTARVMVNRIWHWHFGKGLVPTVDHFGRKGEPPTHPQLLDWLAVRLIEEGWSIKAVHRLIMSSAAYQRSSRFDAASAAVDPQNRNYWRFDVRRLEAEAIRDALLAVSGTLDRTMRGRLLETQNRELVFNHESKDASRYDIRRRSLYVPVIRNHLYDMFQLFDYTGADVAGGSRDTSTVAPQALFLMNSELMTDVSAALADRLLAAEPTRPARIRRLFQRAYGRPPDAAELERVEAFLNRFENREASNGRRRAWQTLCQSVLSSSEFIYVR